MVAQDGRVEAKRQVTADLVLDARLGHALHQSSSVVSVHYLTTNLQNFVFRCVFVMIFFPLEMLLTSSYISRVPTLF